MSETGKHPWWRPAFYTNKEELELELDRYFEETDSKQQTVTWLAIFLWFTTRQALQNYECKPEFVDSIKKAKLKIENSYELSLRESGRTWDIFALKNFWWKDTQEIDQKTEHSFPDLSDEQLKKIANQVK